MFNVIGKVLGMVAKPVEMLAKAVTKPLDLMMGGSQNPASNAFKTLLNPFG